MAYPLNSNTLDDVLDQISSNESDSLAQALRILLNSAMRIERDRHLNADPYERTEQRSGHANGYKDKTIQTRVGQINVSVPQVREGGFYPSSLEKGQRTERALKLALAEMYVQGVSTRKVAAITEQLCGFEVTSSQVSRVSAQMDTELRAWRDRPLGASRYVFLDARYERVRQDGIVQDAAVLIAVGIGLDGKRRVLGCSVAISEAEVHWREFLQSLVVRGLCGVEMVISDSHSGLKAAARSVFGGVPWQRCQFHLQQNAAAYVPKQDMRQEVACDIRAIFNASSRVHADQLLKDTIAKYSKTASKLAEWMETAVPEALTVFACPQAHRRLLRTTNGVERLNREVRRRTKVATMFPNEASCLRLVSAILMETDEEWQGGRVYLTVDETTESKAT